MREDRTQSKQFLETARQIGRAQKDSRVDELRLKLGIRSDEYTVHYARVPRLFADLDLAHGDGRFARLFRMLVKVDLLVLDDWGPDRLSASNRRDLMEIVEDRYGRGSILITSQLPVASWLEVIAEPTVGDAILDRIVHNAYRLELDGPSMRKIKASEEAASPSSPVAATTADGKSTKGAKK